LGKKINLLQLNPFHFPPKRVEDAHAECFVFFPLPVDHFLIEKI